jgi:hypothetical protein
MPYSKAFFELQLKFALKLTEKFERELGEILFYYTTFSKSFDLVERPFDQTNPVWKEYIEGLQTAKDKTDWTYTFYLNHTDSEPTSKDKVFHGHVMFGGFYYILRENGRIIRPHIIKLADDLSSHGPINKVRRQESIQNLTAMFRYIKENEKQADTVLGNSWMYNLEAYRSLYPPEYTKDMGKSTAHEFQFLAMWGQFFAWRWKVKDDLAKELLSRVEALQEFDNLKSCFPYQILRPRCNIQYFYDFYGIK